MYFWKKKMIMCITVLILVGNTGCFRMVEGTKKFHIPQFEEFHKRISLEESMEYLRSNYMGFARVGDVFIYPYIKTNSPECLILLNAYSEEGEKDVNLDRVSLSTKDGIEICYIEDYGKIPCLTEWSDTMTIVVEFEQDESWLFNGNELVLDITISVKKEKVTVTKEMSYDVTIMGYKTIAMI